MKTSALFILITLFASNAFSCPPGQHEECVFRVCACFPDVTVNLPKLNITAMVQAKANEIGEDGRNRGSFSNHDGCMMFVVGGLAAAGGALGGPLGAAMGGSVGYGAAIITCNQWYPN
jgi:hypothetical protein